MYENEKQVIKMTETERHIYPTKIGLLCIENTPRQITALYATEQADAKILTETEPSVLAAQAAEELFEYLDGKRKVFDLPLRISGTSFAQSVYRALLTIPYGETRSYGQIAEAIGKPKAARAVGGANHKNPLMIFVPCHRVIGANGALTGFGAGLPMKEHLLALEKES